MCVCDATQCKLDNQNEKKEPNDIKYNTPDESMQTQHEAIKTVDKLLEKITADKKKY